MDQRMRIRTTLLAALLCLSLLALYFDEIMKAMDGQVVVPEEKPAKITLRLTEFAIPQKEIRVKVGDSIRLAGLCNNHS